MEKKRFLLLALQPPAGARRAIGNVRANGALANMFDRLNRISGEQAANGLAVRFCREVFLLDRTSAYKWQALKPLVMRLDADLEDTLAALRYAVRKGWLDVFGAPAANVMLLEPGRALFASADVALPRHVASA